MNSIYDKFSSRKEELLALGTQQESMIDRREGCYAIIFRQPVKFSQILAEFSQRVGLVVPTMVYPVQNIQTTVTPFELVDNFVGDPKHPAVEILSKAIRRALNSLRESVIRKRSIDFRDLFFSRGVVMAPGWPNEEQYAIVQAILKACGDEFVLKGPWGSQCMVGRFLKTIPTTELNGLYDLIQNAPTLNCAVAPISIDVIGNTTVENRQCVCTTHRTFRL